MLVGIILAMILAIIVYKKKAVISFLIKYATSPPRVSSSTRRSLISTCSPKVRKVDPNHPHGKSASERAAGRDLIILMCAKLGMSPFLVQMSRTMQRRGFKGSRTWIWGKDLDVELRSDVPGPSDVTCLVDVDYYLPMGEFLSDCRPCLLYTFTPCVAACSTGETLLTFHDDQTVEYNVAGGGRYRHLLWDYGGDSITANHYGNNFLTPLLRYFNLPIKTTIHAVERCFVSDDHTVISFTPTRTGRWLGAWALNTLSSTTLTRIEPVKDGWTRILSQSKDGLNVSIARAGKFLSATMPYNIEQEILLKQELSKHAITPYSAASSLGASGPSSRLMTAYARESVSPRDSWVYMMTARTTAATYVTKGADYDQDTPSSMTEFMHPLVDGGGIHYVRNRANDEVTIVKRVIEPRSEVKMNQHVLRHVSDFLDQFFGGRFNFLHPVDFDTIAAAQSRPTQRQILEDAGGGELTDHVKSVAFQKNEANTKTKAPRNITTTGSVQKRVFAGFAMAMTTFLKSHKWYAYRYKPYEISDMIVRLLEQAEYANLSDVSKMDGSVSELFREFDKMLMSRGFSFEHHESLFECMANCVYQDAITKCDVKYNTGTGQQSGQVDTSLLQTMRNAFTVYLALCYQHPSYSSSECFKALGLYGGDDGITPDLKFIHHERAALSVGLKITHSEIPRFQKGVNFLSRFYGPDVWVGDPNSHCDIVRQTVKFHLTPRLSPGQTNEEKLLEKALSYTLTDEHTPIIGPLCRRALCFDDGSPFAPTTWWSQFPKEVQFPNYSADWMTVPEDFGFDEDAFSDWLNSCRSLHDLTIGPYFAVLEPEPAYPDIPVVIDGDVLPGSDSTPPDLNDILKKDLKIQKAKGQEYDNTVGTSNPTESLPKERPRKKQSKKRSRPRNRKGGKKKFPP